MQKIDTAVIGAGVVGLAIASELASRHRTVALIDKNNSYGQETSSRNSEVIHAGIYYPADSLKSSLCIRGNRLLYEICKQNSIPHKNTGKIIAATAPEEEGELEDIYKHASSCGVPDLRMLTRDDIRKLEPEINSVSGIYSGSTGIVDSHALMSFLFRKAESRGCMMLFKSRVTDIEKKQESYQININSEYSFEAETVINCAGLGSDYIAEMAGIDIDREGYRISPCKGEYWSLNKKANINRLIYPVPHKQGPGLGVHITLDMEGKIKFGPNTYYVDTRSDYSQDDSKHGEFYESAHKLFPSLKYEDIAPEMTGIRPKLQKPGEDFRDFIIRHEADRGLAGFINLVGIESPGLTSSRAIAEYVSSMISDF